MLSSTLLVTLKGWHREDLEMLYGNGYYDFSNSFAMHMWFSSAKRIHGLEQKIRPSYFVTDEQKKRMGKERKKETDTELEEMKKRVEKEEEREVAARVT